jgi:hypothetical protein
LGAVSAIYDYEAQQEEEVTFAEGDTMVLYDKDDPDWYLVKLENGEIGLAPSNYLEEVSVLGVIWTMSICAMLITVFCHRLLTSK